jgi:5-formyltetrahydrofolate cyclo-ligase
MMAVDIQDTKATLRGAMKQRLACVSDDDRAEAGRRAADRLCALPAFSGAEVVACFLSMPREIPTDPLIESCHDAGKQVCVPAFRRDLQAYGMARLDADTPLTCGRAGVREPTRPVWMEPDRIDMFVVPGLAFDEQGRRLGRGGGHYDRLLADVSGIKVGLAMAFQCVASVPSDAHDIRMDLVVTDVATLRQ